jgi:hypothetical protein
MLFCKHRQDTAHTSNAEKTSDVEALLHTRRLLMHGIDCMVPKYAADYSPPHAPITTDEFISTPFRALFAGDFGQGRGQKDDAAATCLLSKTADCAGPVSPKAGDSAGAEPLSSSLDAGAVIDALLHDTAHPNRKLLFPPDAGPPGAADSHSVQELPTAQQSIMMDPFHDDWPHW